MHEGVLTRSRLGLPHLADGLLEVRLLDGSDVVLCQTVRETDTKEGPM